MNIRFLLMCTMFRRLGTPMLSQAPLACALSTSLLVGADKICIQ